MFGHRSRELELMDLPGQPEDELFRNLQELEVINKFLGGHSVTLNALDKIFTPELLELQPKRIWRIADLGSGGGDMLRAISGWAARRKIAVHLIGIDSNPVMIRYAKQKSERFVDITYKQADVLSSEFAKHQYDVVTCSLFCHHFEDDDLVQLFSQLAQQCTQAIVLNDIHRNPLAYYSIKWLTAAFSGSRLVKNDAPLSVLRAFSKTEIEQILKRANLHRYSLVWKWAFRWQAIIRTGKPARPILKN